MGVRSRPSLGEDDVRAGDRVVANAMARGRRLQTRMRSSGRLAPRRRLGGKALVATEGRLTRSMSPMRSRDGARPEDQSNRPHVRQLRATQRQPTESVGDRPAKTGDRVTQDRRRRQSISQTPKPQRADRLGAAGKAPLDPQSLVGTFLMERRNRGGKDALSPNLHPASTWLNRSRGWWATRPTSSLSASAR